MKIFEKSEVETMTTLRGSQNKSWKKWSECM